MTRRPFSDRSEVSAILLTVCGRAITSRRGNCRPADVSGVVTAPRTLSHLPTMGAIAQLPNSNLISESRGYSMGLYEPYRIFYQHSPSCRRPQFPQLSVLNVANVRSQ